MKKLEKPSFYYLIGISALSIIQLMLIYGFLTAEQQTLNMQTDLYVDGTDFSPWLSLVQYGLSSIIELIVYVVSFIVDIVIGALLSLITMRILRRFTLTSFTEQTRKTGLIISILCAIVFFLIGCVLLKFHLILDILFLYIPIPIVSFFAYHFGRNPKQEQT